MTVKEGQREQFPLGSIAIEVLQRVIGNRKENYVFLNSQTGSRNDSTHKSFHNAVLKLDIQAIKAIKAKIRFHDILHAFLTWFHMAGVSIDTLRPLMGHSDRATTDLDATLEQLAVGKAQQVMQKTRQKKSSDTGQQNRYRGLNW